MTHAESLEVARKALDEARLVPLGSAHIDRLTTVLNRITDIADDLGGLDARTLYREVSQVTKSWQRRTLLKRALDSVEPLRQDLAAASARCMAAASSSMEIP